MYELNCNYICSNNRIDDRTQKMLYKSAKEQNSRYNYINKKITSQQPIDYNQCYNNAINNI